MAKIPPVMAGAVDVQITQLPANPGCGDFEVRGTVSPANAVLQGSADIHCAQPPAPHHATVTGQLLQGGPNWRFRFQTTAIPAGHAHSVSVLVTATEVSGELPEMDSDFKGFTCGNPAVDADAAPTVTITVEGIDAPATTEVNAARRTLRIQGSGAVTHGRRFRIVAYAFDAFHNQYPGHEEDPRHRKGKWGFVFRNVPVGVPLFATFTASPAPEPGLSDSKRLVVLLRGPGKKQ